MYLRKIKNVNALVLLENVTHGANRRNINFQTKSVVNFCC